MAILDSVLAESDFRQKTALKAAEYERAVPVRSFSRGRLDINIRRVRGTLDHRFAHVLWSATLDGNPLGFGADGDAEIESTRSVNPPLMVPDPLGAYIKPIWDNGVQIGQDRYREDPLEALLQTLERTALTFGVRGRAVKTGRVARTSTPIRPQGGSTGTDIDGEVARQGGGINETLATIIAGAGTTLNLTFTTDAPQLQATTTSGRYDTLRREGQGYDTSPIGTDTISAATVDLYGQATGTGVGDTGVTFVAFNPSTPSSWATSDYANFGSTEFATRKNISTLSVGSFNQWSFNASGLSHIDGSGYTLLGVRIGFDLDGSGDTWASGARTRFGFYAADDGGAGTTRDPLMTVTHAAAAGGNMPSGLSLLGVGNG